MAIVSDSLLVRHFESSTTKEAVTIAECAICVRADDWVR